MLHVEKRQGYTESSCKLAEIFEASVLKVATGYTHDLNRNELYRTPWLSSCDISIVRSSKFTRCPMWVYLYSSGQHGWILQ